MMKPDLRPMLATLTDQPFDDPDLLDASDRLEHDLAELGGR